MFNSILLPPTGVIAYPHFDWPKKLIGPCGRPWFVLNTGTQPITKITLLCDAGRWYESYNGVAHFTGQMLMEGTSTKTAQAIVRRLDWYGAYLHISSNPDACTLTLTTLTKHILPVTTLLIELLNDSIFPVHRWENVKYLTVQALKMKRAKNSYVAHQRLKEVLFGHSHPYGRQITSEAIAKIALSHLKDYYQDSFFLACRWLVSGKLSAQALRTVQHIVRSIPSSSTKPMPQWDMSPSSTSSVHIERKESVQTAISMGKLLVPMYHEDYLSLLVINELLGGYFGSRLMRNVREQKGYTYGIFSTLITHLHISYLYIATEVAKGHAQEVIEAIYHEIKLLQSVPIPEQELAVLRNYMLGTFLAEINDPASIMEKFKVVHLHGLSRAFYQKLYHTIQGITTIRIMELSKKYLVKDSFSIVTVG